MSDAGLPVEDMTIDHLALIAEQNGSISGLIGLEQIGAHGLLRSLVVENKCRSSGLGKTLVHALERLAIDRNVTELWLLTIDADAWFARLGYTTQAREFAPSEIQQTREFASLCPGDAVLMMKKLTN